MQDDTNKVIPNTLDDHNKKPTIRHIVLSGGGGTGVSYYGVLRESHNDGFWNIDDIQTMHGTSCGAIFLFFISVTKHISWEHLDDYCIKRPWANVFGFSIDNLLKAYNNVGICNRETIENMLSPILNAADLSLNVTMRQFYEFTGIEMHFYTTHLNTFELVDVSYKTHPDWELVDAIYSSAALPLLFRPNRMNGEVYVDGGFLCNYPLQQCINQVGNSDEIFGINKIVIYNSIETKQKPEYDNIIDYLMDIIEKTGNKLIVDNATSKYTMLITDVYASAWEIYETLKTRESRSAKIQYGVDSWIKYKAQIGFSSE
jgi:predicted acylesterase/phospholipase RssA